MHLMIAIATYVFAYTITYLLLYIALTMLFRVIDDVTNRTVRVVFGYSNKARRNFRKAKAAVQLIPARVRIARLKTI